ncbi:hypothetical protein [Microbacterium sp. NPDC056569]|uniref:hypothetical protein n=1 Tax=Microbacterium sp. NPDC056569 TaxID=3345867 RepID=UPI00366E5A42
MSDVTIFAPSPTLTVTVEEHDDEPDIHLHSGCQGVWQARMLRRLGWITLTGLDPVSHVPLDVARAAASARPSQSAAPRGAS